MHLRQREAFWPLTCLLLLTSCDQTRGTANGSGIYAYACYSTANARNLEVVIKLDPQQPEIRNLHGGQRLTVQLDGRSGYEVYKRHSSAGQLFDVVEFDGQQQTLTHFYVHYLSEASYAESYGSQDGGARSFRKTYYNPYLFSLIPEKPRAQNSVQIGWNKTQWKCEEIPPRMFSFYYLKAFFTGLMSAG